MKAIKGQSSRRRNPACVLEFLESRTLLSHARPSITVAAIRAEAESTPKLITEFAGKIKGSLSNAPVGSSIGKGFIGYSGHGSSTTGLQYLGIQFVATPSTTSNGLVLTSGSGQFSNLRGTKISVVFTGTATAKNVINLTGSIVSGTGQFDGETGTFTATGTLYGNGKIGLSYAIYLTPATT